MAVVDEIEDAQQQSTMCFTDFLEALCRLAVMKVLPTAGEVKRAGAPSVYEYMRNVKRRRKLVRLQLEAQANGSAVDPRTLAQKLGIFLPIVLPPMEHLARAGRDAKMR